MTRVRWQRSRRTTPARRRLEPSATSPSEPGEIWIDTSIRDPLPQETETIRVRAFGAAYFELARAGGRIADWLSLGERIRVLLPGVVLELAPDGEDTLPARTIRRVIEAVEAL